MDNLSCFPPRDVVLAYCCAGRINMFDNRFTKMKISINYVVVEKFEEPVSEGFQAVEIQDSFVYKGKIVKLPETQPMYLGDDHLALGDVIIFAKYSPDTVEIEIEGKKLKFVKLTDVLAKL